MTGAKVYDKSLIICHILDIARQDLDSELLHIRRSLRDNLVRKAVSVSVDCFNGQSTDDLAHIAFERILNIFRDFIRREVEKIPRCKLDAVRIPPDHDLRNGVYIDVDIVIRRHRSLCTDRNTDLSKKQPVCSLQDRNTDTTLPDQDAWSFSKTRDNKGGGRRSLDVADDAEDDDCHDDGGTYDNCEQGNSPF